MKNFDFVTIFENSELLGNKVLIKSNFIDVMSVIKEKYGFNVLKEITAVDKKDFGIELNYRLYSIENDEEVILAFNVKDEAKSVSKIFDSAVADEKEIYDLFGVKFIGNDELKRLYMPESFKGHPLKKDYVSEDERLEWND